MCWRHHEVDRSQLNINLQSGLKTSRPGLFFRSLPSLGSSDLSQKKRRWDFSTKLQKSRIFIPAENKQTNDDDNTACLRRAASTSAPSWKVCSRARADSKSSAVRRPGHRHTAGPWRTTAVVKTAHAALARGFRGACAKPPAETKLAPHPRSWLVLSSCKRKTRSPVLPAALTWEKQP